MLQDRLADNTEAVPILNSRRLIDCYESLLRRAAPWQFTVRLSVS